MPEVVGSESGIDGGLHFKVRASLRWIGHVASYEGHLNLPEEAQR